MDTAKPLDNFPLIRSCNVEEVRAAMARVYAEPVLSPTRDLQDFDARINNCRLERVSFAYGALGSAATLAFPATGVFSMQLPIRGTAELRCRGAATALRPGAAGLALAAVPHETRVSADYEYLVLRVDERALTEKLAAMTGATINEPLQIAPQQDWGDPAAQILLQYVPMLVDTLSSADPPFPAWWVAQTEQLLMTLFLCGYRHNYSDLLEREPKDAAPAQVRRAEEYIEANSDRPLSLDDLAAVTGVSAFGLFSAFKKHRGYTPQEFLAQVRARRAGML